MQYFVYIIENQHGAKYIGQTASIDYRLSKHNHNEVFSTKNRGPWHLILVETFETRSAAMRREKFLKSLKGGNGLKRLLEH